MKRDDFLAALQEVFAECHAISSAKNQDYADTANAFKNFETASLANISLEKGIYVRILDKMTRIGNLLDREGVVADEKLEDTIKDAINYLAFIVMYQRNEKAKEQYAITRLMPPTS